MKKIASIRPNKLTNFAFCLSLLLSTVAIGQQKVETDDYHIMVPDSWKPLSEEYIEALSARNRKSFESNQAKYPRSHIIGYSLNDPLAKTPPFFVGIFNELDNYATVSFDSIVTVNCAAWESMGVATNPVINPDNSRFYLEMELSGKFIFVAYIPGKTGLLQLTYYSELDSINQRKPEFLDIYNSIEHFQPFKQNSNIKGQLKQIMQFTLIGLVLLAGVLLLFRFIRNRQK